MNLLTILFENLCALPILCFMAGIICSLLGLKRLYPPKIQSLLIYYLLLAIGLKGGICFVDHATTQFFLILSSMTLWGLVQPFVCYWLLRRFTQLDAATSVAIGCCFGSVSLMTFAAGTAFLDNQQVSYETLVIPLMAIMEIPAIFSGVFISKWKNLSSKVSSTNLWVHTLVNKTILVIFFGLIVGWIFRQLDLDAVTHQVLMPFKPCLYLFLLSMGVVIGQHKQEIHEFTWSLGLFGCYMPLIGAAFGLMISYCFGVSPGTGTLIALLSASASYIAVPAAMKIALPEAKETIYLPLSLAIAFPFNILIGIPVYYKIARAILG